MKNRGTHEHMHVCSTWEYVENQKGVINKKSTKNRPPATQAESSRTENWKQYLAMIDRYPGTSYRPGICIKTHIFSLINS